MTRIFRSFVFVSTWVACLSCSYPLQKQAETVSNTNPFIVIDQFGYPIHSQKIAVIRNPKIGFDADRHFSPGEKYQVVNIENNNVAFSAIIVPWNNGKVDPSSGDQAWWFDFSDVTKVGTYVIRDPKRNLQSHPFKIAKNPYRQVLVQAMRSFYYQRAGYPKQLPFADKGWTDKASHLGALQDANARLFSDPTNSSTERDLQGGWFDAGDYNKYSNWTADYIVGLLHAYFEKPELWTDDFNIPESGNGIPDILDEIKWGMDWLIRMQNTDGSVLSIVGLAHASPPSVATGASFYGPASTSATLTSAGAFALGATIFGSIQNPILQSYSKDLRDRAVRAWQWAELNPSTTFYNNNEQANSKGLGAGQQEVDEQSRLMKKLIASLYLFELTGEKAYQEFFSGNYQLTALIQQGYAGEFMGLLNSSLLHYLDLPNIDKKIATQLWDSFIAGIYKENALGSILQQKDPYRAFISHYTWGSSSTKSLMGTMIYQLELHKIGTLDSNTIQNISRQYLHYLHGANPLGKVFLSNMSAYGAENSVDSFYHSWFAESSLDWSSASESSYGPAPGFLVGGPNPMYRWDSFCDNNSNDQRCGGQPPSPPFAQPPQKSYKDMNTSWPINSWEITENSNGYQTNYIRLLSKFVE